MVPCERQAASGRQESQQYVRVRIVPLAEFLLELAGLIHQDLAVFQPTNRVTLQGPRRRAFEVDARNLEAGAVTGALELLLAFKPVRRAAQMGASRAECVNNIAA